VRGYLTATPPIGREHPGKIASCHARKSSADAVDCISIVERNWELNEASARPFGSEAGKDRPVGFFERDLRPARARAWQFHPVHAAGKLACLLAVTAGIFFAWQGFVSKVQYFGVVASRSRPLVDIPIATTIVKFVRTTFGMAPLPPPSAYDIERQMSPATLISRWEPLIAQASQRFGLPQLWLEQVMRVESGGRTMSGENAPIVSRAGAMGLMQLMPATYADMRAQYGLGANPFDPHDNVFAGAAYLKWLHGKYGYPAMFAAYNDGPGNFDAHMSDGRPLPEETRNYITRIADISGAGGGIVLHHRFAAHMVKLTRPNGTRVEIDAAEVVALHAVLPGEYAPGVQSVIKFGHTEQGVRESLAKVTALMRGHKLIAAVEKPRRIKATFYAQSECGGRARCEHSLHPSGALRG
jgi:hypothetical protein